MTDVQAGLFSTQLPVGTRADPLEYLQTIESWPRG
jgi:hypothetical protein